jgi:hypothetical protein
MAVRQLAGCRQVVKIADVNRIPMDALSYPWAVYIPKAQQWVKMLNALGSLAFAHNSAIAVL